MITGGSHYSRTFYLQICLSTLTKWVKNDNFLVKSGLFICEFSIRRPKCWILSTANYEGNLCIETPNDKSNLNIKAIEK